MRSQPWSLAATAARQTASHTPRCTAAGGQDSQIAARGRAGVGLCFGCRAADCADDCLGHGAVPEVVRSIRLGRAAAEEGLPLRP